MQDQKTTRAEQLAKIPETITRADYRRLIESVGLEADDLLSLTFHSDSIAAKVAAVDEDGHWYIEKDTEEIATHTISIKVIDR